MAKSNAERQAEYRERRRMKSLAAKGLDPEALSREEGVEEDPLLDGSSAPDPGERSSVEGSSSAESVEVPIVQTEAYEQMVRDRWGYGASEKRSEAERQATADRIAALPDPLLREPG